MSDRRTKVRYKRLTFTVTRATDGAITITYNSKKFGLRRVNLASQLADELREVKPVAFAAPDPKPTTKGRKRKPWPTTSGVSS